MPNHEVWADLDLLGNQALHIRVENVLEANAGTPSPGRLIYDPGTQQIKIGTGTAWVTPSTGGGGAYVPLSLVDYKGDILVGTGNDTLTRLGAGFNGQVLTSDAAAPSGVKWAATSGIPATVVDAKGDLIVGSANDVVSRLPAGTNGDVLTSDSTQPTGVKWASNTGGVSPTTTISAGSGLTGGGDLSANRTINVGAGGGIVVQPDAVSVDTLTIQAKSEKGASGGYAALDASVKVPIAQVPTGTSGSTVALGNHTHSGQFPAIGTTVTAGAGLTGGGDLSANRTFDVGAGTGILVNPDAVALDTGYTDGRYINTTGDTMTGALVLSADPVGVLDAVTKQYVDNKPGVPGPPGPPGAANGVFAGEWVWTTKTDDAATSGQLGVNGTGWAGSTSVNINQQKSDNTDVTPYLAKVEAGDQIHLRQKTDSARYGLYTVTGPPTDMGSWWRIPVTVNEYAGVVPNGNAATIFTVLTDGTSFLDQTTADGLYVNVTGDVMSGSLILNADPTLNLGAATKQYVDSKVSTGGGGGGANEVTVSMTEPTDGSELWMDLSIDTPPVGGGSALPEVFVQDSDPGPGMAAIWVDLDEDAPVAPTWWSGTQTAYNALAFKDASTMYIITGP